MEEVQRTLPQNSALHLWCKQIAQAYNEKGLSIQEVIKHFKMEVMWTPQNVKEILIKTAIKALYCKKSTTELSKGDIDRLVDVITMFNGQVEVEYIPFPSQETLKEYAKKL